MSKKKIFDMGANSYKIARDIIDFKPVSDPMYEAAQKTINDIYNRYMESLIANMTFPYSFNNSTNTDPNFKFERLNPFNKEPLIKSQPRDITEEAKRMEEEEEIKRRGWLLEDKTNDKTRNKIK